MENRLSIEESPGPASCHTTTGASSQFFCRCRACDDGGDDDGDDGGSGEVMVMVIIVIMMLFSIVCENKRLR